MKGSWENKEYKNKKAMGDRTDPMTVSERISAQWRNGGKSMRKTAHEKKEYTVDTEWHRRRHPRWPRKSFEFNPGYDKWQTWSTSGIGRGLTALLYRGSIQLQWNRKANGFETWIFSIWYFANGIFHFDPGRESRANRHFKYYPRE